MAWTRDVREGAGLDVRDGTGDCAGGGDAAEERNDHVGDALAHQFLIGVVAVVGHRVGHAGAQQAFNGTEHGDRDHRAEKLLGGVPLEVGDLQPIVSTGRPKTVTMIVESTRTTTVPGRWASQRFHCGPLI